MRKDDMLSQEEIDALLDVKQKNQVSRSSPIREPVIG